MKIILAPAKEMNPQHVVSGDWQLSEKSRKIMEVYQTLSSEEIQDMMQVSKKKLREVLTFQENFSAPETYRALELYNGLVFRQIEEVHPDYLEEHLRILSAFYGVLKPGDRIKPYRLDFNMSFQVEGEDLRQFWGKEFDRFFEEGELVLNLASVEFSSCLTPQRYQWVDFDFYEVVDGLPKRHSTISKKARGLMVTYLNQKEVTTLEEVKVFDLMGYAYVPEESTDHCLVFRRDH